MPLVKVEIYKGKNSNYKKGLLDGIHNALVSAFKIPESDRIQRLIEYDEFNFKRSNDKTDNFTIIEITAFQGRSIGAKRKLYQNIFQNLAKNPGISEVDIIVNISEHEMQNWGFKGKSGDEIDFGFEIEV